MERPLISIVVPVRNRESLMQATLNSLWSQTYRPFEVVLVDDASDDDSLSVCEAFRQQYNSAHFLVRVLSQPVGGANAARNAGFRASTGDYVWFFDSDDCLYPDALSRVAAHLLVNEAPDLMVFPFVMHFPDGRRLLRPHRFSADPAAHLVDTVTSTHNICIKRSLVVRAGCWDETLLRWQDLEFGFRLLLRADSVVCLKGMPFHEVRVHDASISGNSYSADSERLQTTLNKIESVIKLQENKGLRNHLQRALCFKRTLLAGSVWREGEHAVAASVFNEALQGVSSAYACLLRLVYLYLKLGGRGVWRIF